MRKYIRAVKTPFKITETDIKKQVKQYLTLMDWFVFPILQSMGSYRGIPDMIAVKSGHEVLFLEAKTPKGRQSEHQKRFQARIEEQGGIYILFDSLDSLINQL